MATPTSSSSPVLGGPARRRAVLAGVGFALLVLVALTIVTIALAEHAVRREAERRVRTTAVLSAQVVAEHTLGTGQQVTAASLSLSGIGGPSKAQLRPADRVRALAALNQLYEAVPGATGTLLLDPLGRAVLSAGAAPPRMGTDLSGLEWTRVLLTQRAHASPSSPYLSSAYPAPTAGSDDPSGRAIAVAAWVRSPSGRALGVLAVVLNPLAQASGLTGRASGDTGLTLTDQNGVLVTSSYRRATGLVSLRRETPVTRALGGGSGVEQRDIDGRPNVSGYAAVAGTGWTVIADVPAKDAFADVTRLRLLLLAATAIAGFGLVWLVPMLVLRLGQAREQVAIGERFQADLLPAEMPPGVLAHYAASERRLLLGGDFIDAVTTPDGGLALLVGDVCGHGPRAAALGARLRAGWRTLATAGEPVGRLDLLDLLVASERPDEDLYATVAVAYVPPGEDVVQYALAGHPPLLLDQGGGTIPLEDVRGAAIGLGVGGPWDVGEHPLWPGWTLALFTDGLIEARTGDDGRRLEIEGVGALLSAARSAGVVDTAAFVRTVRGLGAGDDIVLDDDVALLVAGGARRRRRERPDAAAVAS